VRRRGRTTPRPTPTRGAADRILDDHVVLLDAAQATTSGSVARSGAWALLGQVLPQFYTIVTSVIAAHYLGVSGLGRLSFIAFVEGTVILCLTLAFPSTLMRHVGELLGAGRTGAIRPFLAWGLKVQGVAAAAGAAILLGAAALGAQPTSAWIFAAIAAATAILHTVPSALLIGTQRWRQATIVGLISGTVALVAKVGALLAGYRLPVLFGIDAVVGVANLLGTSYLASATLAPLPSERQLLVGLRSSATRFAAVASVSSLLGLVVWQRSELFFLNHYSTDRQIALYTIPFSFVTALLFIPDAAARALVPAFATLYGANARERIRSGYSRAVRILMLLVLPITAVSMALGPTFLRLLYGSGFKDSEPVLLILLASLPAVQLLSVSTALLTGLRRPWPTTIIALVATVVNLGLDFLLIPPYAAIGAAIANATAQLVGAVPIVVFAARAVGGVDWPARSLSRAFVASLAAGSAASAVVFALPPFAGLVLGFVVFACVFFVGSSWLRVLPTKDAEWLGTAFGGRMHGIPRRIVLRIAAVTRS
jgi:O-antigen/teichoic acid export membrane protein